MDLKEKVDKILEAESSSEKRKIAEELFPLDEIRKDLKVSDELFFGPILGLDLRDIASDFHAFSSSYATAIVEEKAPFKKWEELKKRIHQCYLQTDEGAIFLPYFEKDGEIYSVAELSKNKIRYTYLYNSGYKTTDEVEDGIPFRKKEFFEGEKLGFVSFEDLVSYMEGPEKVPVFKIEPVSKEPEL